MVSNPTHFWQVIEAGWFVVWIWQCASSNLNVHKCSLPDHNLSICSLRNLDYQVGEILFFLQPRISSNRSAGPTNSRVAPSACDAYNPKFCWLVNSLISYQSSIRNFAGNIQFYCSSSICAIDPIPSVWYCRQDKCPLSLDSAQSSRNMLIKLCFIHTILNIASQILFDQQNVMSLQKRNVQDKSPLIIWKSPLE